MTDAPPIGFLRLLVFTGGLVTLGAELAASRLLAPYFGTSIVVWSSLIGLILLALSLGNWIGGRLADRRPDLRSLLTVTLLAALMVGFIPFASRIILKLALSGFAHLELGMLLGSFFGTVFLLGLPMIVLGCITPWALRLAAADVEHLGRLAGQFFALGTAGSFLGVFLPTLWLIPSYGTARAYLILALLLLGVTLLGFLLLRNRKLSALSAGAIALGVGLLFVVGSWKVRPDQESLMEKESPYQFVRVVENDRGWRELKLNEGFVTHSKYHPHVPLTFMAWDYFTIAPFFNPAPFNPHEKATRWAIIGCGAGTVATLLDKVYEDVQIDGVEIDPVVVQAGWDYFDARRPNYQVTVQDGRSWIKTCTNTYDVICVDAYRQPYIPFELSSVEFFEEAKARLSAHGVLVVNVSSPRQDLALVNTLAATMDEVFPSLFLLHLRQNSSATLIVATVQPAKTTDYLANMRYGRTLETLLLDKARGWYTDQFTPGLVLTDDHAPVERLMDLMIFREVRRRTGG